MKLLLTARSTYIGLFLVLYLFGPSMLAASGDGTVPPSGAFDDPLQGASIELIIARVIQWLLGLTSLLALGALIWGGVMYITSLGNDQRLQRAKQIVMWAIIGLVIITLAFVIIQTVQGALTGSGTI